MKVVSPALSSLSFLLGYAPMQQFSAGLANQAGLQREFLQAGAADAAVTLERLPDRFVSDTGEAPMDVVLFLLSMGSPGKDRFDLVTFGDTLLSSPADGTLPIIGLGAYWNALMSERVDAASTRILEDRIPDAEELKKTGEEVTTYINLIMLATGWDQLKDNEGTTRCLKKALRLMQVGDGSGPRSMTLGLNISLRRARRDAPGVADRMSELGIRVLAAYTSEAWVFDMNIPLPAVVKAAVVRAGKMRDGEMVIAAMRSLGRTDLNFEVQQDAVPARSVIGSSGRAIIGGGLFARLETVKDKVARIVGLIEKDEHIEPGQISDIASEAERWTAMDTGEPIHDMEDIPILVKAAYLFSEAGDTEGEKRTVYRAIGKMKRPVARIRYQFT